MTAKTKDDAQLPEEKLPMLPLRQLVLFPGTILSVEVGRKSSLALIDHLLKANQNRLLVVTQLNSDPEDPEPTDLAPVAMEAEVLKMIRVGSERYTLVLQGVRRCDFHVAARTPFFWGAYHPIESQKPGGGSFDEAATNIREAAKRWVALRGESVPTLAQVLGEGNADVLHVADLLSGSMELSFEERLDLLLDRDVFSRLQKVHKHAEHEIKIYEEKQRIDKEVSSNAPSEERKAILREQLKKIQEELGEDGLDADWGDLADRLAAVPMPDEVRAWAKKHLRRLHNIPANSPEYTTQRTYLEWICDLPWETKTSDPISMEEARTMLDQDHAGLEKVKKRILEYIAVRKLAPEKRAPLLCLVGPPGVGKTSLGQSIARVLGRRFVRISLGGVRDEAEIRGHRRTYIGALPGRFLQSLKRAGTKNPVLLLDEIDKIGMDYRGDPASALLEVLDPEQNKEFSDHYLEIPFDLSQVLFCATANTVDTIPEPLLDRMELIEISGYTREEKKQIALRHLIPKQMQDHGLPADRIVWPAEVLDALIVRYTREAGVRQLEREIASVCRAMAAAWVSASKPGDSIASMPLLTLTMENLSSYLGVPRFEADTEPKNMRPGMVAGLSWSEVGGNVMWIEADSMPGTGQWIMTGQLGSVMRESVQAASSWVRMQAPALGIAPDWFEKKDIHVHIPSGAIPKEGPSAGVAMVAALLSQVTGNVAHPHVAMTGEITLRGRVLPVGGIKEKLLAAHRAGMTKVLLPRQNEKDLQELPTEVRAALDLVLVDDVATALDHVLVHPWRSPVDVQA